MRTLTQELVKSVLDYDRNSGAFTWTKSLSHRVKVGQEAGSVLATGYLIISLYGNHVLAHRLAWLYIFGALPNEFIDHINMCRSDNRLANLRLATKAQNSYNREKLKTNTSGYKGVGVRRDGQIYAQCMVDKKNHWLGYFPSLESASLAYQNFATAHQGEHFKGVS